MHRLSTTPKFIFFAILLLSVSGCLSFGEDIDTSTPTVEQIDRCRREMYLQPNAAISPIHLKVLGSGIDDAMWFTFKTDADSPERLFDDKHIDVAKFNTPHLTGPVDFSLPGAKHMSVTLKKITGGYWVHIEWFET